jgi:hypothetical protein
MFQQGQHLHVPTGFNDSCEERSTRKTTPQGIPKCVGKYYQPENPTLSHRLLHCTVRADQLLEIYQ